MPRPSRMRGTTYEGYEVRIRLVRRQRYAPCRLERPLDVHHFFAPLRDESSEYLYSLALDAQHRINSVYLVGKGGVHESAADPKEVLKHALLADAAAVMLVHNHPSGDPEPSPDDRAITYKLRDACELLQLPLVDHVIVAAGGFYSFSENGFL